MQFFKMLVLICGTYQIKTRAATITDITKCLSGQKFCLADDDRSGVCCEQANTDAACQKTCSSVIPSVKDQTFESNQQYLAFTPELITTLHKTNCGGDLEFQASATKTSYTMKIQTATTPCEYRIKVPTLIYRNSAKVQVFVEKIVNVLPFLYSGTDRSNLTTLIESASKSSLQQNQFAVIGAPYSVQVSNGAVFLVASGDPKVATGTFQFSIQVVGETYPWYEYIFIGREQWVYYLGLSGLIVAIFLVLTSICGIPIILLFFVSIIVLVIIVLVLLLVFLSPLFCLATVGWCICTAYRKRSPKLKATPQPKTPLDDQNKQKPQPPKPDPSNKQKPKIVKDDEKIKPSLKSLKTLDEKKVDQDKSAETPLDLSFKHLDTIASINSEEAKPFKKPEVVAKKKQADQSSKQKELEAAMQLKLEQSKQKYIQEENEKLRKELDKLKKEKEILEQKKQKENPSTSGYTDQEFKDLAQSFEQSEELRNVYKDLAQEQRREIAILRQRLTKVQEGPTLRNNLEFQ